MGKEGGEEAPGKEGVLLWPGYSFQFNKQNGGELGHLDQGKGGGKRRAQKGSERYGGQKPGLPSKKPLVREILQEKCNEKGESLA